MNVLDTLVERGFVQDCTDRAGLENLLSQGSVVFYAGFDPTADSLHVGSLLVIMAMAHLQRTGNVPVAIVGGGTGMIGDPSGKTESRQLLTQQTIRVNMEGIRSQLERFLKLEEPYGYILDNSQWIGEAHVIYFMRDIGVHFRVNEMLRAESVKSRLDKQEGMTFLEFFYPLLQAWDFMILNDRLGCRLQIGGSDQWGNIIAGVDLIKTIHNRRADVNLQVPNFGLTLPLVGTASGQKMGKTESGAIWLDARKTSPYDFFQFWINTDDRDVHRFLAFFFTFLSMEEVNRLGALRGADLRSAKEVLAFEVTRLVHGEDEARRAAQAARVLFSGLGDTGDSPTVTLATVDIVGIEVARLALTVGLVTSISQGRRLIEQGGLYLNNRKTIGRQTVQAVDLINGALMLRVGRKRHLRVLSAEREPPLIRP